MNGKGSKSSIALFLSLLFCSGAYAQDWQQIVDRNKNALITIRYYAPYSLNNEDIVTFFASGAIVDKEKGIVVVDRESAQVSPSVLTGYLQNYEEVDLKLIYYDPVHNFAFLKFDPSRINWAELANVRLGDSDSMRLGDEIVLLATKKNKNIGVVHGNIVDIREPKLRNQYKYQDYNINYFDTSLVNIDEGGGVLLNKKGEVIALHAWIHEPDSSNENKDKNFYGELPINFIKDAYDSVKVSKTPQRGDLGLVLTFMNFSDAFSFGVSKEAIDRIRGKDGARGLLFVSSAVKGTPNEDAFRLGDIIVSIDGNTVRDSYYAYEKALNSKAGEKVSVKIFRDGSESVITASVIDLQKTKPQKFAVFTGGIFQNLPWFIRVRTNIGSEGVYVSSYNLGSPPACAGFFENNVIVDINGYKVTDIDQFYSFIKKVRNDELIRVRYYDLVLNSKEQIRSFRANTKFFPTRLFTKGELDGEWNEVK